MRLVNYKNSIVLLGDTKHLRNAIVRDKLGIWVKNMSIDNALQCGWCFKPEKLQFVLELLKNETYSNETNTTAIAKHVEKPASVISVKEKTTLTKLEIHKVNNVYSIGALKHFLMSNLHILAEQIGAELNIASIVMNDTSILKDDGKRYLFLGAGCGFSYIECDKRNKLAVQIIADSTQLKRKIDKALVNATDIEYRKKLEKSGNPLEAHLFQNLNYKACYNGLVYKFMSDFIDMKKAKVWIRNIDD